MSWHLLVQQKLRAALLSLAAVLTPLGSSSDAQVSALCITHTPGTLSSTPRAILAIESAIAELKRAARIVEAFAEHGSHPFQHYMEDLEQIMEAVRVDDLSDVALVTNLSTHLSTNLSRARMNFECNVESASDWCRLTAAVDPSVTTFKIPPRFIRVIADDPEPLEPWSSAARRAWMANLAES